MTTTMDDITIEDLFPDPDGHYQCGRVDEILLLPPGTTYKAIRKGITATWGGDDEHCQVAARDVVRWAATLDAVPGLCDPWRISMARRRREFHRLVQEHIVAIQTAAEDLGIRCDWQAGVTCRRYADLVDRIMRLVTSFSRDDNCSR